MAMPARKEAMVAWAAPGGAPNVLAIAGRLGRYMSMAMGGRAGIAPSKRTRLTGALVSLKGSAPETTPTSDTTAPMRKRAAVLAPVSRPAKPLMQKPPRLRNAAMPDALATQMPAVQYVAANGIRMAYYEAGPRGGVPIVFCHGFPELAFSWRHQIAALAAAGRWVIAPDQRGYGLTTRPAAVESYDLEHLTGDLVGLLDHLKVEKAIFAGHDWGGFVVWQMPLRHPARVAGVVGINTPHTKRAPSD